VAAAVKDGINLVMISGYRSYAAQVSTYNGYVAKDGKTAADTYSARPGHSEHQTGWAADLGNGTCDLEICFGDTKSGKWLATHAHEYGFIIRYPLGKEAITGYQYEPWHLRFVGLELSAELFKTGQTMEEFFGVVPAKQPY
jgi:D-alanyl-D-alanine carboxypeptidase